MFDMVPNTPYKLLWKLDIVTNTDPIISKVALFVKVI